MKKRGLITMLLCLCLFSLAMAGPQAEKKPQPKVKTAPPMYQLTEAMVQRLTSNLQVKTVVGNPIKVGKITLIPIMMIDIGFGGGGGGDPQNPDAGGKGFGMSGEARPIGFVVVTKEGTKFISVGKIPAK